MRHCSHYVERQEAVFRTIQALFGVTGSVLLGILLTVSGCASHQVRLASKVGTIQIQQKFPVRAALLINPETRAAVLRRHSSSFVSWIYVHDFQVGAALEQAAVGTFSQVFQEVVVVDDPQTAKRAYSIFIEPAVEDIRYFSGLLGEPHGKIRLRVSVGSGDAKLWEASLQVRRSSRPSLFWNPPYDATLGDVISSAMSACLEEMAVNMAKDSNLAAFLKGSGKSDATQIVPPS